MADITNIPHIQSAILRFLDGERVTEATPSQIARGISQELEQTKTHIRALQLRKLVTQHHLIVLEPSILKHPLETGYLDGSSYVVSCNHQRIDDLLIERALRYAGTYDNQATIRPYIVTAGQCYRLNNPAAPFQYDSTSERLQLVEVLLAQRDYQDAFRSQFGKMINNLDNWRCQRWLLSNRDKDGVYPHLAFYLDNKVKLRIYYAIDFAGCLKWSEIGARASIEQVVPQRLQRFRNAYKAQKVNYELW